MLQPILTAVPDRFSLASSSDTALEEPLHTSQVANLHQQPNPLSPAIPQTQNLPDFESILEKEIIRIAATVPKSDRHHQLADYFYHTGDLKRPWYNKLRTKIKIYRKEAKNAIAKVSSNTADMSFEDCAASQHPATVGGNSKKYFTSQIEVEFKEDSSIVSKSRPEKKAKLAKTAPNSMLPMVLILNTESDTPWHERSQSLKSGRSATANETSSSLAPQSPDSTKLSLPQPETIANTIKLSSATVVPKPTKRRVARKDDRNGSSKQRAKAPRPNPPHDIKEQQPTLQETELLNIVKCRNEACPTKHFTMEDLRQDYSLSIQAEKIDIRKLGFWMCPPCASKVALMSPRQGPKTEEPTTQLLRIPKNMGTEWLEDSEIRDPLEELSRMVLEFTAYAFKNPWPNPQARAHILDVPCIRDESTSGTTLTEPLVPVLRKMLKVEGGVLIAAVIRNLQVGPEHSLWISAILSFLLKEFIFSTDLPFDDPSFCLLNLGYNPQEIARILQSTRLKTLSDRPADFSSRLIARREAFVDQLNQTMMPLVGYSPEKTREYKDMALIAEDLALKISAYTNNYVPIYPSSGERLNTKEHMVENGLATGSGTAQYVLLTTMPGVKVEISDGKWRICSQAKVRLWPVVKRNKRPLEDGA